MDEVAQQPLVIQNTDNVNLLLAKYTREKKSATDLSAVDYNRWQPNLPVDPQDLRFIIEDFAPQRGGMDTSNYAKAAWQPTLARGVAVSSGYENFGNSANYGNNASTTGNSLTCETILDPSRACGEYCNSVSGYTTFNKNNVAWGQTGQTPVARPMTGRPQPNYPFEGPTSQQIKAAGIASCGENLFWGPNYTQGSCGAQPPQTVLLDNFQNTDKLATMAYSSVA